VDYREALDLQHSLAAAVAEGTAPDTVLFLEHPATITLGRRTEEGEVHVPECTEVEVVEVDRGGKSTYHAPGQLVCYPILDLTRHGQDVKKYCRDLEEALIRTLAAFGLEGTRIEGLTGIWLQSPPRKIASIGIHLTKWISTHGYALNVDLDPAPFTDWITARGSTVTRSRRWRASAAGLGRRRSPQRRRRSRTSSTSFEVAPAFGKGRRARPLRARALFGSYARDGRATLPDRCRRRSSRDPTPSRSPPPLLAGEPISGRQYSSTSSRPIGFACSRAATRSAARALVQRPEAAGGATKPSARSDISAFRSWRESTTRSSLSPPCASSRSTRSCGITPTTSPPAASAASATAPISPTRPPP
jgi:lipoyl(octanoyl) transferase